MHRHEDKVRLGVPLFAIALGVAGLGVAGLGVSAQVIWPADRAYTHLSPKADRPDTHLSPKVLREIARVEAEINAIEAQTIAQIASPPDNQPQQVELLGKAILFDPNLSVNRNEACAFCHMPEAGFTGPVSELNRTTSSYPGSVRTRFGNRKPQTYGYAPFAPVLHYNPNSGDLIGGNFWDMRATGRRLGNPAAEQALGPPTNPVEMGLPDTACFVYRASLRPYRTLFEQVWGVGAFAVRWPANVEAVCNTPGPPPANDPLPVHLSARDRSVVMASADQMVQSIAQYEASAQVSPLSSKYDAMLAGKVQFTPAETEGLALFRGKANCNQCHIDGGPSADPLFTDFTAVNIGVPPNPRLAFYAEDKPDAFGYVANPLGLAYVDFGVGAFLASGITLSQPSPVDARWVPLAPQFQGTFRVPTLRNVDKRPYADFVKDYAHNGYFKSLKEIVHFYNTRDVLPRCGPYDPGEGVTCWPAPESSLNLNTTQLGNLGLTDAEENAIVAFLRTLTDGFTGTGIVPTSPTTTPPPAPPPPPDKPGSYRRR
jgi:cytochrome c peroxidase